MADNSFSQIQQGAFSLLDAIKLKVKEVDDQLIKLDATIQKIFSSAASTPNALTAKVAELELAVKKLNEAFTQQKQNTNELTQARISLAKRTAEEVVNQRALAKAADTEAKAQSKLVGAYQNLIAKRDQSKRILQDLIASERASNAEIRKAQKEFDKYNAKVNQANKAVSNFSKTSLGGMVRGFRNLAGAFGVVGGAYMLADFVKNIFQTTKTLQSLDYALKTVTKSEEDYARVQTFLNDITEKYGVELVTTTERYTKFLTAAQQSNVSMQDTEKIFESVTKAAGVLGLKTHELEGVYLALEQMLSKGKVTTEELRRQLGERLPGAFGIMADAIGVNVRQLDAMLKKGEVLSAEALPKFADALEKAYGIENVDRIETLQAAHTRMSNAWINFVKSLDGSEGTITKVFTTLLNFATKVIDALAELNKGQAGTLKGVYDEVYKSARKYYEDIENQEKRRINVLKALSEQEKVSASEKKKYLDEIAKIEKANIDQAETTAKDRIKQASLVISMLEGEIEIGKEAIRVYKEREGGNVTKEQIADYDKYNNKLGELEQSLQKEKAAYDAANDYLNRNNKEIVKNTEAVEANVKAKEKQRKQVELVAEYGSKRFIEEQIKSIQEQIDATAKLEGSNATLNQEYVSLNEQLEYFKSWLDRVYGSLDDNKDATDDLTASIEEQIDALVQLLKLAKDWQEFSLGFLDEDIKFFGDAGFDSINTMINSLEELNDIAKGLGLTLAEAIEGGEIKWEDYFNGIAELGQDVMNFLNQSQQAYFDAQFERLRQEKEDAIRFAGESASAREYIEEQYDEKKRELQRRQAESEKEMAIFNATIDMLQGIVSAIARVDLYPYNFVLAGLIGVLGAAQISMISSQSVPQFFRGTENAPEGWAWTQEYGAEIITDRQGKVKSLGNNDGATLTYLEQGDRVFSHDKSKKLFNDGLKNLLLTNDIEYSAMNNMTPKVVVENKTDNRELVRHITSLENTIKNKQEFDLKIDKNGFYVGQRKNGARTERLNNIIRLKGKGV